MSLVVSCQNIFFPLRNSSYCRSISSSFHIQILLHQPPVWYCLLGLTISRLRMWIEEASGLCRFLLDNSVPHCRHPWRLVILLLILIKNRILPWLVVLTSIPQASAPDRWCYVRIVVFQCTNSGYNVSANSPTSCLPVIAPAFFNTIFVLLFL